jgi:hypothetical protein
MAMIYTALKIAPMTVTMPLSLRYPPQVTGFSVYFCLFILDYLLKSFVSIKETAFCADEKKRKSRCVSGPSLPS